LKCNGISVDKKAEKRWRKLKGYSHIEKIFLGVEYIDGVEKKTA
jgi:hypothetical protein